MECDMRYNVLCNLTSEEDDFFFLVLQSDVQIEF